MKKTTGIILVIILAVIVLAGLWSFTCVRYFTDSVKRTRIVIEDVGTGIVTPIRTGGISVHPRFSRDGRHVYFLNRPADESKPGGQRLMRHSPEQGETITVATAADGISLTGIVLPDGGIICYKKERDQDAICRCSVRGGNAVALAPGANAQSDASLSPDGKWIAYIEKDAETSRNNVCVIPAGGGRKRTISDSRSMLGDVRTYTWTSDSKRIGYIDFITLVIRPIEGEGVETIDLAGLTNFRGLMADPVNPDRLYVVARKSDGGLSFSIYVASRRDGGIDVWKDDRSFWEMHHALSPDGRRMAYSTSIK